MSHQNPSSEPVVPESVASATSQSPVRRELRGVVRLATPVVLAQVGLMLMGFVDSLMLGRVSELDLAASALANAVFVGLAMFPMGVLFALDALVSQAWGAKDTSRVAAHAQRGLATALGLSVLLSIPMLFVEPLMRWAGQSPELVELGGIYVRLLVLSNPAHLLFVALRQTLQAMGRVRPAVVAMVVGNVVNVIANTILIFGKLGAPALGVEGSAHATNIARWVMLGVMLVAGWPALRPLQILGRAGDAWRQRFAALRETRGYRRIFGLGVPIGFQTSLELWAFVAVALMMGNLGARELAAHQIALNLAAMTFMVPLGIGGAAATRVGNAIGRSDSPGARRAAAVCLALGASVMTVSAVGFYLFPEALARLFTPDLPVITLAATLLPIAALFQVFDGLQVVGMGVLRGTADTRVPAVIAFIGYWCLGLPFGWYLARHQDFGPQGLWLGLTCGLASVAVLLLFRIRARFRGELSALDP